MSDRNIEKSVKEKIEIWENLGKSNVVNFSLSEYEFYLNNYIPSINNFFINLNITQDDLNKNSIDKILKDASRIYQIGFEFDSITDINFQKLKDLLVELKENNELSNGLNYIKYKASTVKERDIGTVEREAEIFKQVISEVTDDMSDFEKFSTIYRKLGKMISYDYENAGVGFNSLNEYLPQSNLEGVINGKSICGGYSLILKQALELVGIEARSRTGGSPTEGIHAWNQVKLDDVWYNTDLTYDADKLKEEKLPNCLKSDDTFQEMGYVDTGDLFMTGEEKEKCPIDFSYEKMKEVFEDYIIRNYNFLAPTSIKIAKMNGLYDIFIRNMENNIIQFMRITSSEQLYNLFDVVLDGRKLKLSEEKLLKSRNITIDMDVLDIEEYLQDGGLDLGDFIKSTTLEQVKKLSQSDDSELMDSLVDSGVEAGLEVLGTGKINDQVIAIRKEIEQARTQENALDENDDNGNR